MQGFVQGGVYKSDICWCIKRKSADGGQNMEKRIKIIGDIEVGGERGRVMDRGGAIREYDFDRLQRSGKSCKEVERIGQAHSVESQSGIVYNRRKSIVTLIAGTHGYAIGYVVRKYEERNFNLGEHREYGKA